MTRNGDKMWKPKPVSRNQMIIEADLNQNFRIHNGRQWVKIRPTREMVGLKYGEFAKTRTPHKVKKKGK